MSDGEVKGAPMSAGWTIAAGVALVAFGVSVVVFDFSMPQAGFVALVLLLVVGVILGLPGGERRASLPLPRTAAAPEPAMPVTPSMIAAAVAAPAGPVTTPSMIAEVVAAPLPGPGAATPGAATKPQGLAAPRDGRGDDLKIIKGIGPKLEILCHQLGYFHFDQIAAWTPAEIAWVDDNLEGFKGRVTRDNWAAQARVLAAGGTV